jgi:outer membrane receptor protein involved in Fe transport
VRLSVIALPLIASGAALPAQGVGRDSVSTLGAVVVVAERSATATNRSTAAITRLTAADLDRLPHATVADVLRRVPGIAVVDFDGSGRDAQLMVRGFYGGGEADYVLVMVDGRVVNLPNNGTIAWEALPPLQSIESIEIVRGSSSTLHGDAAVAGVINIVTRGSSRSGAAWRLGGESFGGIVASAEVSDLFASRAFDASVGFDRTEGFRDHASRASATLRGAMQVTPLWRGAARVAWRDFEEPGPLLESMIVDGSERDPRFSRDGGDDLEIGATLGLDGVLGAGGTIQTMLRAGSRQGTLVRTLPLAPEFGDTRERELRTLDLGLSTQANLIPTILPPDFERFSVGASIDLATIDSRYFSDDGGSRNLDARGDGRRTGIAGFAHLVATPNDWLRWTVGARVDVLSDGFEPEGSADFSESHFAFSPKAGLNIRYADGPGSAGRAWISASRTFKAPTLDQLFDQRPIPVPFPPFSLTTSNPDLDPQRGTSAEAGIYHEVTAATVRVSGTATVYRLDMRNELDFDVQTLKYVNIGRSRHRGVETGVTVAAGEVSGFASWTVQDAIARAGPNEGNRLKAIPRQLLSAGVTLSPLRIGTATVSVTRTADMFIDDANTRRIPSWTRVDAQLSRSIGSLAVVVGARNLSDTRINGTGFLDPSGSGQAYFYPSAGRVFTIGLRHGR